MHNARIEHDPEYVYTLGMINYLKEAREKTRLSLKLSTRLQEKKRSEKRRLDLENRLRKSEGLKPLTNLEQLQEDKEDTQQKKPAKDDPILIESSNILVDYRLIQAKANATRSAQAGKN
jgi:carboxyl-terminal processing protease